MSQKKEDISEPVEVAEGIYWIGFYDNDSKLNSNPYLILDGDDALVIDPGSIPDFPVIMRKIIDITNPENISAVIVAHQDPDVCGNLPVFVDVVARSDLKVIAHGTTHRLIYHYGYDAEEYRIEDHNYQYTMANGRELKFMFTPYLHSPGAIVTYDEKTRSLFTSDIFGSLSKDQDLFAGEDFPKSMDRWHQSIMPGNAPLNKAMKRFRDLQMDFIFPQHGSLIAKDKIETAISHLENLPCGVDLMPEY